MKRTDYATARRRWRRSIQRIAGQVGKLATDDHIFRRSMELAEASSRIRPSNLFYQFTIYTYGTHAAMGIRRLLDTDKKADSLRALLYKIKNNPQVITRRSFVGRYRRELRDAAHLEFDSYAGLGAAALSIASVEQDVRQLDAMADRLLPLVHRRIAHRQRRGRIGRIPRWQDIHDAIACIERITRRWLLILEQAAPSSFVPANIDDYEEDWRAIWS